MLSNVSIKALYGLYSYALEFHPEQKPYRFVTGPNAYGKTSLLKMIESLYKQDFNGLSKVVFDEFQLVFDDGFQIHVDQQRIYDDDPNSDDTLPKKVVLTFSSKNINCLSTEGSFEWESDNAAEIKLNNMTAYLASHPIYFITDNRLYKGGSELTAGQALQDKMKTYLQDMSGKLNSALQQGMLDEHESITEEYYNERVSNLKPLIDSIVKYELVKRNPIPTYSVEKSAFCNTCIIALEKALEGDVLESIARLDAFCLIVDNYDFANKIMELSPYFGFRFKAADDMSSILSFDQLSSGERHIVLMNYDILFDVSDEALVLIDEPELSFHLEWQGQFMTNLEELEGVRKDLQFIICTHAPEMFSYEWDLSVDLFDQANKQ